jgi:hypothetical protein
VTINSSGSVDFVNIILVHGFTFTREIYKKKKKKKQEERKLEFKSYLNIFFLDSGIDYWVISSTYLYILDLIFLYYILIFILIF